MLADRRALPLAFCLISVIGAIRAQAAELPPIFAPRPAAKESPALEPRLPPAAKPATTRVRAQLNEAVLAMAANAPAPVATTGDADSTLAIAADGVVMMRRYVVKSVGPSASEISPPPSLPPLLRFALIERADRRIKPAWQVPLLHGLGGYLHLDVVNGAGQGLDHGRDFTRVELGFTRRF